MQSCVRVKAIIPAPDELMIFLLSGRRFSTPTLFNTAMWSVGQKRSWNFSLGRWRLIIELFAYCVRWSWFFLFVLIGNKWLGKCFHFSLLNSNIWTFDIVGQIIEFDDDIVENNRKREYDFHYGWWNLDYFILREVSEFSFRKKMEDWLFFSQNNSIKYESETAEIACISIPYK